MAIVRNKNLRIIDEEDLKTKLARYITARGQYVGFHKYEDAPDEVAFLRHRHRHVFKWEATIQVFHDDRELEFFMVKDLIENEILKFTLLQDNLGSCEMQAEKMLMGLLHEYGTLRYYQITVSEDGENDGTVEWDPDN